MSSPVEHRTGPSAHYVSLGRWTKCLHCGVIRLALPYHAIDARGIQINPANDHYCGAPWQTKADDIPDEWTSTLSAPPGSAEGPSDEALFAAKADAEKNAWRPPTRLNRDEATALISAFLAARDRSRVLNRDEAIDDRNAAEYAELQDELLNALTGESK